MEGLSTRKEQVWTDQCSLVVHLERFTGERDTIELDITPELIQAFQEGCRFSRPDSKASHWQSRTCRVLALEKLDGSGQISCPIHFPYAVHYEDYKKIYLDVTIITSG